MMSKLIGILFPCFIFACVSEDPTDSEVATQALDATPSAAASDDFTVRTIDSRGGGSAQFVDNGPAGDDYIVIHDLSADGHGVKAYAWINGIYFGSMYNGNGLAGAAVTWRPWENVFDGDSVGLKVCLVDGDNDPTASSCGSATKVIHE